MGSLRLSELAGLSEAERDRRLAALVAETRKPVSLEAICALDKRIAAFEAQHGITSAVMRQQLAAGTRKETYAVCQWLMAIALRDSMERCPGAE